MPWFRLITSLILLCLTLSAWGQSHTVYMVGDAGEPFEDGNPVIKLIQSHFEEDNSPSSIIYLGDNVYPRGLPELGHPDRHQAEEIMKGQLDILKGYRGQVYVIPGNHDWEKGKKGGYQQIKNQEAFVEEYLAGILGDSANTFLPDGGCPGPVEIELSEEVTLIILDTQWLLHPWEKPREINGCEVGRYNDVFAQLEEMVRRNDYKKVIVAAHHPMYSYGIHGGVSNAKQHIFPLTDVNESLYIPIPIIGSIYPLYRKLLGNIQDIQHPKYKAIRNTLEDIFSYHPNLVFVSGHEHSLQYIAKAVCII